MFELVRRDRQPTTSHLESLLGLALEHRIPEWIGVGLFAEGWFRFSTVGHKVGIAAMRDGIAQMRSQQRGIFMPLFMTLLAEAEAEAGCPDVGLTTVDSQLATIERTGQRWYLSEVNRARGEILLKCRPVDAGAAESAFMLAIDIARNQAAKLFELRAALSLARLWRDQGKRAEARDLLGPIYHWFTEGFDAPDLKDAKALLAELT
jgi:predicted ATPase